MGWEALHLGGASAEAHSSISRRYVDHPVPVLHQQQVLPGKRSHEAWAHETLALIAW